MILIMHGLAERQYLNLIKRILKNGSIQKTRNGMTQSLIGETMRFSLKDNKLPLLTTKHIPWKTCLRELLWFIRGKTDNKILLKNNVRIWSENASRGFLNSRGLYHLEENDLGPIYGHQWRYFNAPYKTCEDDYTGQGIDQLGNIITSLQDKKERYSRRLILSAWNPLQLNEMALPPCHILAQFHVTNGDSLSCSLYQRSGDVGLGIPFNIASYSFLTHLLAHHCHLKPNEFIHFIGNAHIYDDHQEPLLEQIRRVPKEAPKIIINAYHEDISDYKVSNFEVVDYDSAPPIKMEMRP